jgi:hypothetical protein
MSLHRLRLFILSHGFDAVIKGDHVEWYCPAYNRETKETSLVTFKCRSFNTARDQLGY